MEHGWLTGLSRIYSKKEKDKQLIANRKDVENAPAKNERSKPGPDASKQNKNKGGRIIEKGKSSPRPAIRNRIHASNQLNRRQKRRIGVELSTGPFSNLSDVQKSPPLLKDNFIRQKCRNRKDLSTNKKDVRDAPTTNEMQTPGSDGSRKNKTEERRVAEKEKCTSSPKIRNKIHSSNQPNRTQDRRMGDELRTVPCSNSSDVQRSHTLLQNNSTRQTRGKSKLHKPSIQNSRVSVYYVSNDQTTNQNGVPYNEVKEKGMSGIQLLLPNQPDYT